MKNSYIIGCGSATFSENKIIYFRKHFTAANGSDFKIKIFADARYKLYLNGSFVNAGPSKANDLELFYDEFDLGKYLKAGENEIEVRVLCLASEALAKQHRFITSLRRSGMGVLEISGTLDGEQFITDKTWECAVENAVEFIVPEYAYYTGIPEHIKASDYKKVKWEEATEVVDEEKLIYYGEPSFWYSYPSMIPSPKLVKKQIRLKPNSVYDFGYLATAYLEICLKGKGRVKLTYAERYTKEGSDDRADLSGEILGDYDIIDLDGELLFEPYWFRCFRFIKIEVDGDVEFTNAYVYETGYPIEISDEYDYGDETDNKLWEISRRTLKRCMHDTFNDCPYYEQLQYAMDTYLQSVYAYQVSPDDRLQRKAIRDFAMSQGAEGLTQCRTPSAQKQYIPSFSLYYVMMVVEHFNRYGDKNILDENIPHIMRVFSWYRRHSSADYLVEKSVYWHFIDWAADFMAYWGVPPTEEGAALGIESLILSYTLKQVARITEGTAYESIGREYSDWAQKINNSVNKLLYSEEKGLYSNTENKQLFSQHAQVWAVLSECADENRAKKIMEKSFELIGSQTTFAYAFFLFRALEKTGLYELRKDMLDQLRQLVHNNCSTVPETPVNARSECHAWSAVALYEFTAMDLGINQADGKIIINPYTKERKSAKGTVYTAFGAVYVSWEKKDGKLFISYKAPDGVPVEVVTDDECETVIAD